VIDGFAGTPAPSQIQIDTNCTIRNFPASSPLTTNFSFLTQPGQTDARWLIVFDNVVHTGQMACNSVAGHKIWFVNGSSSSIQEGCQNLLIPVEKIDKQNPAGQTTASIGVPFTYTLTIPVLFDPATGSVINSAGSPNDLHSVTVWDDLNATGADLTYLSHVAYWQDDGIPVPHTFSNVGGLLTFDFVPVVPAGQQIVIELTVVLDQTPANAPGTQFVNTAQWDFGRLIDGVFYEPLPGEWGITQPMTIAAPELVVSKTGPATLGRTLNLGEWGQFEVDVLNTGLSDAWEVTILDRLPDGPTGGMCDLTPEVLSAQVLAADGVTPVPGKGPLTEGTDYTLSYSGAPGCELTLTTLTAAGAIGPNERLIVTYRTRLDADSQDGATLTNVAGATRWYNADSGTPARVSFTRALTDGTVGVLDHEDAHTVTVALFGYFFEKTVENLTTGVSPAATAAPGDTLRYSLRLQTTDVALNDLTFYDDLGELNASAVFVPGTLALVSSTVPSTADPNNTLPSGGTNGAGILDIRNLSMPENSELSIQFDITLDSTLADGTVVLNQADLIRTLKIADSDDPTINGQADPSVVGDEDPTRVVIQRAPPEPVVKANTQATATIGEEFSYRITVPETPNPYPMYDVAILDDLQASAADLRFVSVTKISSGGTWTPVNSGTDTNLVIEDPNGGIDVPAGDQIEVEITVVLEDTATNVAGLTFTNTASYTFSAVDGDATPIPGPPGMTEPMTIVEPELTLTKSGPAQMTRGVLETFTLDLQNTGDSPAWNLTITDQLPNAATGGTCDQAPTAFSVQLFEADGVTPVSGALVEETDFSVAFSGDPTCRLAVSILSAAGAIGPTQRLIVSYQTQLDPDTRDGVTLTNVAGATEWFGGAEGASLRRSYSRSLSDGTPGVLDHEDAHTVSVALASYLFEKTVANLTSGADPATTAAPGDVLRYRLRLESLGDVPLSDLTLLDELDALNAPPAFEPNSLTLVSVPPGADPNATTGTGGAQGTGQLEMSGLSLAGVGSSLLVEFDVTLAAVLPNGMDVSNQAQLSLGGALFALSDDPGVNGPADPFVAGDEDPTRVQIQSAPAFRVEKTSADLTADPNVLLPGETLRYTLTIKNVGTADAIDATLRDAVPVNTSYVAGSTTLNGDPVPDGPGGTSPLSSGIPIYAPEDPTPGAMRADASATPSNVATVVFDVVVDPGVVDGTVLANQGFVSAAAGGVVDQPSDDPGTAIPDDPTRDVVGASPLLFAPKSVELGVDGGTPGVVDPGDVLHYTITVYNTGPVPATGATLTDSVPADTTYRAGSTFLNGLEVADAGGFPLAAGLPISSTDQTPPLPSPGAGVLSAGESAVVEFDLQVDATAAAGTVISNQAVVATAELPDLLTDGDGNPATGPEPTVVVVGDGQQLSITKQVTVVGGGELLPGSELEYAVTVVNIGVVPAYDVIITDDLDAPVADQLSYGAGSATLNGSAAGVSFADPLLTADYFATYGPLAPGGTATLRFRATVDPGLAIATTIENMGVVTWNAATQRATASVSVDVGGMPGVSALGGTAWHDADFDGALGAGEQPLEGWSVDLYRNGTLVQSVLTDSNGAYRLAGLEPNAGTTNTYLLRFRAPDAGPNTAALGTGDSPFTNGPQEISDIILASGASLQDLNLPLTPNGVAYDALLRGSIARATLRLLSGGTGSPLPATCFEDPAQQGQVTRADGFYKFDLNFSDAACPAGGSYRLEVTALGSGYVAGPSQIIPPTSGVSTPPFSVPACPASAADAVPSTAAYCEAQPSELAPLSSADTTYYLHLTLDDTAMPGSSQIFNNHVPLDPQLSGAVGVSKTASLVNVSRGQLVPYEITITNELGAAIPDLSVVDRFPAGFRYVAGSAQVDGVQVEPTQLGQDLVWADLGIEAASSRSLRLLLAVGAGVSEGEFVNRAWAASSMTGESGTATATVRVVPDPTFSCTDALGKVYDDANRNGTQDAGESGLAGVRVVTVRGLAAVTDPYGRFHITCAITPNEARGSNFVLKLDDRTLPTGYRMSTRPLVTQRATRGKALRFSFGASIHRMVGLDLANGVFEPGSTDLRPQWRPRLDLLIEELERAPASLRLSYVADVEDARLVERRLRAVKALIAEAWLPLDAGYELEIESEIFWRRGAPPDRRDVTPADGR
jgi:uncharacterized repeat protein (TIGR01451 family)/fimbrial isopeptide formation D2 family protein